MRPNDSPSRELDARGQAKLPRELSESAIVRALADKTAERLAKKAIATLQRIEDLHSGDDSGLKSAWDEICVQVQHVSSYFSDAYDETVRAIVQRLVEELSAEERDAIWLQTDEGDEWESSEGPDRESNPVSEDDIVNFLVEEYIYERAANWSNARIRDYLNRSILSE